MKDQPFPLTAAEVASAIEGRLLAGDPTRPLERFSTDTRTLRPGDVFLAIEGERFDGHAFIEPAWAAGASGVIVSVEQDDSGAADRVVILVADTTRALQLLARHIRRLSGSRVVAITGSAGKTTTKEVAADFLELRFRTYRSKGNLNNQIGLPLSLLALQSRPEYAVLELGMSHAGEIRTLVETSEPDVRVWTNVGEAHLESFASVDAVADAKAEILEGARPDTHLVANAADARVMERARRFRGKVTTFGVNHDADVSAENVRSRGILGMSAALRTAAGEATLDIPLLGLGNLANVLAAIAVALVCGVPLAAIVARAATLMPAPHRGEVLRLGSGIAVIDDSYNSNPQALTRAIEILGAERDRPRRVAVLGEMLELGERSVALHRACGEALAAAGIDLLVSVGGRAAEAFGEGARGAGLRASAVVHVPDVVAAGEIVARLVAAGDVVLVKGSRGIHLDRLVEGMKAAFV